MSNIINRAQLQARLDGNLSTVLVEALPAQYYRKAHLPGAINVPHDEITERASAALPDKDAFIVVYCANTECRNSAIATQQLTQLGYHNVHEYVEGKQDWIDAGLPVEQVSHAA